MAFNPKGEGVVRTSTLRQGPNPAASVRAVFLLLVGITLLSFCLTGIPSSAQGTKEEKDSEDYPELFQDVAQLLRFHYIDMERASPKPLTEKAFSALENAVDEIYVEQNDALSSILALHVDQKVQTFNVEDVDTLDKAVRMLENAFEFLKRNYHGETALNEIRYAAVNGFLMGLDPHTVVFSPESYKDFSVHIEGEIGGIGMYVGSRDGKLTAIEVLKDTPAFRAGFKKGDLISKIDDESTINMTVNEAVDRIRGPRKSTVTLTVKRLKPKEDGKPESYDTMTITVERDRVVVKSVESKLISGWNLNSSGPWKGGVGYVKVINFDKNTTPSLKEHLNRLKEQNGGAPLAGLILDLRDNSGGLLTQAVEMSDLYLKSGTIVITASRQDRLNFQEAQDDKNEPTYPMVVLANEASASGAEIVIGALQKNDRAIVVGTRTFGKGSVQQLQRLRNEAQLKLTVSEYLLPGKISIQENGVVPNVLAKPVILDEGGFDLFPNERSVTEKSYERHIVSRYAKEETPDHTVEYLYDPPKEDLYSDRFMSGDLEPEKDKLVEMSLSLLALSESPFKPSAILKEKKSEIEALKAKLFQEIVEKLKEKGIDWSQEGAPASSDAVDQGDTKLDLELATSFIKEPSGDKDDPLPVNKLVVTARLRNKGEKTLYRIKGLSRSEHPPYKDHEFLFGKVAPGETVERSVKIRLPYFPLFARNDVFTVEVSAGLDPGASETKGGKILVSRSIPVELTDVGRPAFAYSAQLLNAVDKSQLASLRAGTEALLRVKIKNTGTAPAFKGIAILRNETEPRRQVFLGKGRIEFPPIPDGEGPASAGGQRQEIPSLKPGEETEVEFAFEVRDGEPVEQYDFELAIVDSYSGANIVRKLAIPRRDREELKPFPNGVVFAPCGIEAQIVDPETKKSTLVTNKESLSLDALVKSCDGQPFKAWVFTSVAGDQEIPDKILFTESEGEPKLAFSAKVPLKKGANLFTVVSSNKEGIENRQSVIVRRE